MEATDSERGLVGALILFGDRIGEVRAILKAEDFAQDIPKAVFTALCTEDDQRRSWDLAGAITAVSTLDKPGEQSWEGEIVELVHGAHNSALMLHHAREIKARSTLRKAKHALASAAAEAQDVRGTPDEVEAFLAELLASIAGLAGDAQRARDEQDAVDAMRAVVSRHRAGQTVQGLSTGIGDLDDILLGLRAGELVILGARPGAGKTALAMQVAINVAEAGTPGIFLSLEMPTDSLGERLVSNLGSIDSGAMRRGNTGASQWGRMDEAVAAMAARKSVWLISEAGTTLAKLRGYLRKRSRQGLLGFLVVDYLQLMRHPGVKDKLAEVGEISRGLKEVSIEFAIPVIALSQLNRAADGQEPTMANLRESGSLEQDADVVILLSQSKDDEFLSGQVAKNRHGRTDKFALAFMRNYFRIRLAARSKSEEIFS